jgi:hypothetical protein
MGRAYSVNQVLQMNKKTFPFEGEWHDAFGEPERVGVWFISGDTGNGKTSFVMQLIKELCKYVKVGYDSLEEGTALTLKNNLERFNMQEAGRRFVIYDCEPIEQISERLLKRKSPDVVVIDSFQYSQLNYKTYIELKEKHKNKLIIFISHVEGKKPTGRSARSVQYDATLKIWVEGYKAFSKGRFIGPTGEYTIWDKGAYMYWGLQAEKEDSESV